MHTYDVCLLYGKYLESCPQSPNLVYIWQRQGTSNYGGQSVTVKSKMGSSGGTEVAWSWKMAGIGSPDIVFFNENTTWEWKWGRTTDRTALRKLILKKCPDDTLLEWTWKTELWVVQLCCGRQSAKETLSRKSWRSGEEGTSSERGSSGAKGHNKYRKQQGVQQGAINNNALCQKKAGMTNFQLIFPYLAKWGSVILCPLLVVQEAVDATLLIFLSSFQLLANDVLKTMRPVISLDIAHLWSVYKGMLLCIASFVGCQPHWSNQLHDSKLERGSEEVDKNHRTVESSVPNHMRPRLLSSQHRKDADQVLKPALKDVFPDHIEMCAKHTMEANVAAKSGRQCGKFVTAIAKTYSVLITRHFSSRWVQKASAVSYIEDVTKRGILWSNLQWTANAKERLPLGLVLSHWVLLIQWTVCSTLLEVCRRWMHSIRSLMSWWDDFFLVGKSMNVMMLL